MLIAAILVLLFVQCGILGRLAYLMGRANRAHTQAALDMGELLWLGGLMLEDPSSPQEAGSPAFNARKFEMLMEQDRRRRLLL
jgi:hypothetical protein